MYPEVTTLIGELMSSILSQPFCPDLLLDMFRSRRTSHSNRARERGIESPSHRGPRPLEFRQQLVGFSAFNLADIVNSHPIKQFHLHKLVGVLNDGCIPAFGGLLGRLAGNVQHLRDRGERALSVYKESVPFLHGTSFESLQFTTFVHFPVNSLRR